MNKDLFQRQIYTNIKNSLFKGKVVLIYGARQIGKTTLLQKIMSEYDNQSVYFINGDEPDMQKSLATKTSIELKKIIGNATLLCIDEAQNIQECSRVIKLIHDTYPEIQVIATGSSAFYLQNTMYEALTGRNTSFHMSPLMVSEFAKITKQSSDIYRLVEDMLIWGMYPEMRLMESDTRRERLTQLSSDYLYKDIFAFEHINKPQTLQKLLKIIASQIGDLLSIQKVANDLGVSRETVERYVTILERSYIIFRIQPYSKSERLLARGMSKVYFWDNGIRNGILGKTMSMELREDKGKLFENFIISEMMKRAFFTGKYPEYFFWRYKDMQEIDIIEKDINGNILGFECKYKKQKVEVSKHAPVDKVSVISADNFMDFLEV